MLRNLREFSMLKFHRKWSAAILAASCGSMYLAGCTTDLAAKDFLTTTLVRVVFQALGQALQVNIVDAL